MKIHSIITNNELQNIFYVIEYGDKKACVIDPCDSELTKDFLTKNKLSLEKIVVTHEHDDHYSGVIWLDCEDIFTGEKASKEIPLCFSDELQEWESIILEEYLELRVIETPGHTPGHISLEIIENEKVVGIFVGDTVFSWGVGNTYSGDTEVLHGSIQKFQSYEDDVILYSGHDYLENNFRFIEKYLPEKKPELEKILKKKGEEVYFTSLWEEKCVNPFLSADKNEFIRLRELRNTW